MQRAAGSVGQEKDVFDPFSQSLDFGALNRDLDSAIGLTPAVRADQACLPLPLRGSSSPRIRPVRSGR